ncbi:S9 family peptidase [Lacunimicrobium album]
MVRVALLSLVIAISLTSSMTFAQGTKADYERADRWGERMRGKATNATLMPSWIGRTASFWYRHEPRPGEFEYLLVKAGDTKPVPAFDHAVLAGMLSEGLKKEISPSKMSLSLLTFNDDFTTVELTCEDKRFKYDIASAKLEPIEHQPPRGERPNRRRGGGGERRIQDASRSRTSSDKSFTVDVKDKSIILKDELLGEEKAVWKLDVETSGESISPDVYWSGDQTHFVAMVTKPGGDRKVYYVESSPRDQLQPKLHSYDYLKPGDDTEQKRLVLVDAKTGDAKAINNELYANQWSLDEFHWSPDGSELRFSLNQRGHQVFRVLGLDVNTGNVRTIIDEQSPTFLDWAYKRYLFHLRDTDEYVWASERDGWRHLYLYDGKTGQVKCQLTSGEWVVRDVIKVDEKSREIVFDMGGYHPEQSPYYKQVARINMDSKDLTLLTEGDGSHSTAFSPDGSVLVDTWSRVDLGPVHVLRDAKTGKQICELASCDMTALKEAGWVEPERFVSKGRDGKTDIYGVIYRPSNFDASKKYPIIEWIYAGPHGSHSPVTFSSAPRQQSMAELGFVVVSCDGMGTSDRSKAFHDVAWKNIADAGFPDRKLWITAAASTRPWMDLNHVGIGGGSAGGQNAMRALIDHHDFYHVAVADCGCHDNRMDKIWWNEQWMGWPIGPHYDEQSNVTGAKKMEGKLFLIVGEKDENVDPASTMQVVDALLKANKDFDMLVVPGGGHGSGTSNPTAWRKWRDFYVRHLHGVEPRSK